MTDFSVPLPKYAALVVHGEPVTPEQAAIIIVRTDQALPEPSVPDKAWREEINLIVGVFEPYSNDDDWNEKWEERAKWEHAHGCMMLSELGNNRIASSHLGGWCDWNGTIGCDSFRVGKWTTIAALLEEWQCIADAFPFLRLTAQVWNCDPDEIFDKADAAPVAEFVVEDGEARVRAPKRTLPRPRPMTTNESAMEALFGTKSMRGCTAPQLRWGIELAARAMAAERKEIHDERE